MILNNLIIFLENMFPSECCCDWDNSGLIIGDKNKNIKKIYICLDARSENIEEAIKNDVDLIITHHPFIFSGIKNINFENFLGKRIKRIIENDMSLYSIHTNYDAIRMSKAFINIMDFKEIEILDEIEKMGYVCKTKETMTIENLVHNLKSKLSIDNIIFYGDKYVHLNKIAIIPGSGKSFINTALKKGCDTIITGDIDHHSGIDAVESGINVIDAFHSGTEKIFIDDLDLLIRENFNDLFIIKEKYKFPFEIL